MAGKSLTKAVAYFRTSSAANTGADKDSEKRQRQAVGGFAAGAGYEIVESFYDEAVSGTTDLIDGRPGFSALLDRIEGNGVRVVLVEDASRLARSIVIQEVGIVALQARGVKVVASNGDDLTETEDEMKIAMRQIAGVFAQLEKTRLVKKLKAARDRKRATGVKVEGRPGYADDNPELVALARKLHRYPVRGRRRSLRQVAAELAKAGHVSRSGDPLSAGVVQRLLKAKAAPEAAPSPAQEGKATQAGDEDVLVRAQRQLAEF